MSSHTEVALAAMQEAIDRAQIRDSGRIRAHKLALAVAVIAPEVLADPEIAEEHKEYVREMLAECRTLAVGGRAGVTPDDVLDGVPREDVLNTIRAEVTKEISEQEAWAGSPS